MNAKTPRKPSPEAIEILARMMVNRAKREGRIASKDAPADKEPGKAQNNARP